MESFKEPIDSLALDVLHANLFLFKSSYNKPQTSTHRALSVENVAAID